MDNAPHIFAIAEDMFSKMLSDYEKQCVIITGESGAGKTVSMKNILSYLMEVRRIVSKEKQNVKRTFRFHTVDRIFNELKK